MTKLEVILSGMFVGLVAILFYFSCPPVVLPDQCLRARIFKECVGTSPPSEALVVACGEQAKSQSFRHVGQIKEECR